MTLWRLCSLEPHQGHTLDLLGGAYSAPEPPALKWSHLCPRNSLQMAIRICQFSQYLGTKLDMLFEIAKSVEIFILLAKQLFYPKIIDFICQNTILLPHLSPLTGQYITELIRTG